MGPVSKKIFFVVSTLLAIVFAALAIRMNLADTKESCSPESVASIIPFFTYTTAGSILLWAASFLLPRQREWLAFLALLLLIWPMGGLNSSICCHESYGTVPEWAAGTLIVGFLSYSLLFISRAAYASLASIALVIYMFILSSN
jgi:hypothetical protein